MNNQDSGKASEKMTSFAMLIKIFTDPKSTFENLNTYPTWIFPIILSIILGSLYMLTTADIQMEMQKNIILESDRIPEAAKDQALENLEQPSFARQTIFPALGVIISAFGVPLIIGLVLLLFGNFIYGGASTFKHLFSAAAWAGMIGFFEGLIKLPLVINKGTLEIYTSLALVLDLSESKTILFQLLNMVDIFSIWKIVIYTTAFAVLYRFSQSKSYATIIGLYIVWSFITIGFSQLFM